MALEFLILIPMFISVQFIVVSWLLDEEKYSAIKLGLILMSFVFTIQSYNLASVVISEYYSGTALIELIADQTWTFTILFVLFISVILIQFIYDLFMMFSSKKHKTGDYDQG